MYVGVLSPMLSLPSFAVARAPSQIIDYQQARISICHR
jgi:hypothetical protein